MRPGRTAWTRDEDTLLRTFIRNGVKMERMAELLGRSVRGIYCRIHRKRLIIHQNKRSGMTDEQFRINLRRLMISREERRDASGQFSKPRSL